MLFLLQSLVWRLVTMNHNRNAFAAFEWFFIVVGVSPMSSQNPCEMWASPKAMVRNWTNSRMVRSWSIRGVKIDRSFPIEGGPVMFCLHFLENDENVARLTSHWIEWYIFLHLKEVQRTKKSQLESCFSTTCHDVSFWHKCPDRYVRWYVCSTWIYANDILINLYCCR